MKFDENKIRELLVNYDLVKPRIIERLASKRTREKIPRYRVLNPVNNTSLMFEYSIDITDYVEKVDDEYGVYLAIVDEMMTMWDVTVKDISNIAKFNTPRLLPSNVQTLGSMLGGVDLVSPLVIVTNDKLNRGAGCIFYKSTISKIEELIGSEFYILPSSTHEMICVSKEKFSDVEYLLNMVTEMNDGGVVDDEDILDYNVYEFKNKKLQAIF